MKPETRTYLLAGLVAVLAALVAIAEAFFYDKLYKLAAAGKSFGEPEVMEALSGRRWVDVLDWIFSLAIILCVWAASKTEWDKGWKLWTVVLVVLLSVVCRFVRIG
jgi:hypothetical protein